MVETYPNHHVRVARLLVAPPEFVYRELTELRREDSYALWESASKEMDRALLARNEPLITLAVAETTLDIELLRDIYGGARNASKTEDKPQEYFYGLRIACLRNPARPKWSLGRARAGILDDDELERIIRDGTSEEAEALITNPATTGLLISLFRRAEQFARLDDDRWCSLVLVAASNERLNRDDSSGAGPDLGKYDIDRAIATFASIVPVNERGAYTLIQLLHHVHSHIYAESKAQHDEIFARWRAWDYTPEEGRDNGRSEDLKSEVLALLGAVIGNYSTKDAAGKFVSGRIANFGSKDLSERCAFYSIDQMSDKQIDEAIRQDHEYFFMSVFRNLSVMSNPKRRAALQEWLPYRLQWQMDHHSRVITQQRQDRDARNQPVGVEGADADGNSRALERLTNIEAQLREISEWVKSVKAWVYWSVIVIAVVLILRRFW